MAFREPGRFTNQSTWKTNKKVIILVIDENRRYSPALELREKERATSDVLLSCISMEAEKLREFKEEN